MYTFNFSNTFHQGAGFGHSFLVLKKLWYLLLGTEVFPQIFTHPRIVCKEDTPSGF